MSFRYEIQGEPDHRSSIAASLSDYRIRPGVHRVPLSALNATFRANFYSASDRKRVDALKARIEASGWVSPLIVVYDAEGPYVLEGAHRLVALGELGAADVPAQIVDDLERENPTAYHGSQASFTAFTSVGIGKTHGVGYGWGAYLTSDPQTALAYAGKAGAVYVVRIPRGPWMPWSGHNTSRAVRAAAKRALAPLRHVMSGGLPLGEEFYQRHKKQGFTHINGCFYNEIATLLDDNVGEATSGFLCKCGIVGVTYPQRAVRLKDGTLTPEGATNYCVFDPKDLQIVGKR